MVPFNREMDWRVPIIRHAQRFLPQGIGLLLLSLGR